MTTTNNNPTPSSDIDVIKYEQALKQYMSSLPQYTDYDFDGSNLSVLMRIFAYNAYNMAHYQGMVGNEAWIDTAILRQSLVSHATDLNYLPRSRTSSVADIDIDVYPNDNPPTILLPKYTKFKTSDNSGTSIYFVTDQDYITSVDDNGNYKFKNVKIYQGDIINEYVTVTGVTIDVNNFTTYDQSFVIKSPNIDINSLEVFVSKSDDNQYPVKFTRVEKLSETSRTSNTYFVRGIYDNQYAIDFGDGVFGRGLENGNYVTIRYRETQGPIIQGNYSFTHVNGIQGYSNVRINRASRVSGGFERESVEELRINAPRYFQTQDRAVTATDYQVIIRRYFPNIQQVHVYGGEEIQQYGKVIIVLKPYGTTGIVSDTTKNQIIQLLKTKNIVPEPIITNPVYFYIGITGVVTYDDNNNLSNITQDQIKTDITNRLIALNDSSVIGDFNTTIYQSLINKSITDCGDYIIGCDVNIDLRKRWVPATNIPETLSFSTNNPLKKSLDGRYQTPDDYTIISNPFQIWYNQQLTSVIIQDDGIGNLNYYSIDNNGNKIKINQVIGKIDYDRGDISLVAEVSQYNNYIEFIIKLRNNTIKIARESFAIIDGRDINITLERK